MLPAATIVPYIIRWTGSSVRFLDQSRLPHEIVVEETNDYRVLIEAIRVLKIRGAPLIGIAAGYAMALSVLEIGFNSPHNYRTKLLEVCDEIGSARPTAVNLFWALTQFRGIIQSAIEADQLPAAIVMHALNVHVDDASRCSRIGAAGAPIVADGMNILTHCNTGMLATGGEGTAFSVILTAHRQGKRIHVFADETRPLFQGARLTMWELQQHAIPATLITDSTAASLMASKKIDIVITGADRIASNGDTANKIGTYGLAIAAYHHSVPFYIAAPVSTIDFSMRNGSEIPIEERAAEEVSTIHGTPIAPTGSKVYAPAFDVTPAGLITGIITEYGIIAPQDVETLKSVPA